MSIVLSIFLPSSEIEKEVGSNTGTIFRGPGGQVLESGNLFRPPPSRPVRVRTVISH